MRKQCEKERIVIEYVGNLLSSEEFKYASKRLRGSSHLLLNIVFRGENAEN